MVFSYTLMQNNQGHKCVNYLESKTEFIWFITFRETLLIISNQWPALLPEN